MKIFQILGLGLLAISLTMGACKKDDDTQSTSDILIEGKWDLTAATINPGVEIFPGIVVNDLLIDEEPCDADDLTIFNADGSSAGDEGATKCDPSDPQNYNNGTWSLSSDEKTLTISIEGTLIAFIVKSASSSKLVLETAADKLDSSFPATSTVTFTFTKA
ncbi:MAG: lipocalin family protein [Saprospiraceae bacterium]|nr:lipocalin family protein [Saprospiraceae bacterium]